MKATTLLDRADPYLAAVRIVKDALRKVDPEVSREIGNARDALFKAIRADDAAGARQWLGTLDASALLVPAACGDERARLLEAIQGLKEVLA